MEEDPSPRHAWRVAGEVSQQGKGIFMQAWELRMEKSAEKWGSEAEAV